MMPGVEVLEEVGGTGVKEVKDHMEEVKVKEDLHKVDLICLDLLKEFLRPSQVNMAVVGDQIS